MVTDIKYKLRNTGILPFIASSKIIPRCVCMTVNVHHCRWRNCFMSPYSWDKPVLQTIFLPIYCFTHSCLTIFSVVIYFGTLFMSRILYFEMILKHLSNWKVFIACANCICLLLFQANFKIRKHMFLILHKMFGIHKYE